MIKFENYYGLLTDAEPEVFNKIFIEKQNHEGFKILGYNYKLIYEKLEIKEIIKQLETEYKYYYDIQEDRFYDAEDLKELLEDSEV